MTEAESSGDPYTCQDISYSTIACRGDNTAMPCPTCTRLDCDEALIRDAVQERAEALRFNLPEEIRAAVEDEERMLAALLARIEERRAG